MRHKFMSIMLALALGLGLLTGCGAEGEDGDNLDSPGLVQPGEDGEGTDGGEGGDD